MGSFYLFSSSVPSLLLPLSVICSRSPVCLPVFVTILFPSPCPPSHPLLRLELVFLHSKCFSLRWRRPLLLPSHHLFLTCHTLPLWPLSVCICVSISRTLHPLSLLYFSFTFLSFIWAHIPLLPHLKFSLNDSKCLGPVPPRAGSTATTKTHT